MLNRLGYGPRPGDVAAVRTLGVAAWIERQLHPDRIADATLEARLAGFTTLTLDSRTIVQEYDRPALEERRARQRAGAPATLPPDPSVAIGDPAADARRAKSAAQQKNRTVLAELGTSGQLAIGHASGSPDATRSHFDAQDYMESATPGVKSTRDGWLNRYLQAHDAGHPLQAVALTTGMPRALQGPAPALAVRRIDDFAVRADAGTAAAFEAAYAGRGERALHATAAEAFAAMRQLASARRPEAATGVVYPRSPFGQALQEIARLARADVGLEIAFAESTQWDHPANEGGDTGQIANRLDDFARGLAALARGLGDRMADTVIITMSEFGRAVAQNGSGGTDHGHGNAMLVLGDAVKGGHVYGRWPGLSPEARHEGRDLAITTDFRDVFAEIVVKHLGADPVTTAAVFPGYPVRPAAFRGLL